MRTTLNLPDDVYRFLKVRAAQDGITVTSAVEEALRAYLSSGNVPRSLTTLPALAETGGPMPGVDLTDADTVFDLLYGDESA